MAKLADIRIVAQAIVGPICGRRSRSLGEADVGRILHAYLLGRYQDVRKEFRVTKGSRRKAVDFRFGDFSNDGEACLLELAVRNSENGSQLSPSQNSSELHKLSSYSRDLEDYRALLLLDIGHSALERNLLRKNYDDYIYEKPPRGARRVRVLYVHRNSTFSFVWYPEGRPS